jgi:hypothetical protein
MPVGPSTTVARANGYHFDTFLSSPFEPTVLYATVSETPANPTLILAFTTISGSYANVQEGMELEIFTSGGISRGRLRVASGGSTSSVIQVNEVSDTRIPIVSGDTFKVYLSFRVRDKLIGATEIFPKDSRIAYTTQNKGVAPLANDGGHYAAVWRGSNIAVTFYGNLTLPVDFDSNGPFTHAWTVYGPDSLTVAFTSSAENPTFTFTAAGTYWVRHIATDTDVSTPWTKWSVVVLDSNPIPIAIEGGISVNVNNPTALRFQAHANAGTDRLANGAMVLLHEDESIGSFGNRVSDRSRLKFVGYLTQHALHIEPLTGQITFEALSPLGILNALPGFSQALQQVTSDNPATWQEYELGQTTNAILVYLLRWHTTYADLFDVLLPGYNYSYADSFIQQQTPGQQLAEISASVEAFVRCDPSGALIQRQDLNKVGTTERDAASVLYTFEENDFLDVDLEQAHRSDLAQLIYRMFSGDDPLESVAGEAPDEGGEFTSEERKIGAGQAGTALSANERCGWAFAFRKRTYNGVPVWVLRGTLAGSYDWISPAYDQWVKVTLSREVDGYTVTLTNARMWVESVDVQYEAVEDEFGTVQYDKSVQVVFIGETEGRKGKTRLPLTEEQNGLSDYDDPWVEFPQPSFDPNAQFSGLTRGNANIAVIFPNDLVLTSNFNNSSPDWSTISLTPILNASESLVDAVQSPFLSTRLAAVTTASRLLIIDNITTTPAITYANTFTNTSSVKRMVEWERSSSTLIHCLQASTTGMRWQGSNDGGQNLATEVLIGNSGIDADANTLGLPAIFIDPSNNSIAYCVAWNGDPDAFEGWVLYKTTNGGASWATSTDYKIDDAVQTLSGGRMNRCMALGRPYLDTSFMYSGRQTTQPGQNFEWTLKATPGVSIELAVNNPATDPAGPRYPRGMRTCDSNANLLLLIAARFTNNTGIYTSVDKGVTIRDIVTVGSGGVNEFRIGALAGDGAVYIPTTTGDFLYHPNLVNLTDVSQFTSKAGNGFITGNPINVIGL